MKKCDFVDYYGAMKNQKIKKLNKLVKITKPRLDNRGFLLRKIKLKFP